MDCNKILKISSKFYVIARAGLRLTVADGAKKIKSNEEEVPIGEADIQEARWMLLDYLGKIESEAVEMVSSRYEFVLNGVKSGYWRPDETKYEFHIVPKARESGTVEESEFGSQKISYKSPQEAAESIPQDNNYAYRGMAYEEFVTSMNRGTIKSRGGYNIIESQEGLTFFSPRADSAQSYAGGFAPWRYGPTHNRPGVVIGIDKDWLLGTSEHEGIPEGELALQDEISTSVIDYVYYIIPEKIGYGNLILNKARNLKGEYHSEVIMASSPTGYGYNVVQMK